jgi:hypothetical protein
VALKIGREQFTRMAERLAQFKGRTVVSLDDVASVRETFAAFRMEEAELPYSIGQAGPRSEGGETGADLRVRAATIAAFQLTLSPKKNPDLRKGRG